MMILRICAGRRTARAAKMWLECPVEETDDRGRKTRTTEARDNRRARAEELKRGNPLIKAKPVKDSSDPDGRRVFMCPMTVYKCANGNLRTRAVYRPGP